MIGAELTFALQRELKTYVKSGALSLRTGCRLTSFLLSDDSAAAAASTAAVLGVVHPNLGRTSSHLTAPAVADASCR